VVRQAAHIVFLNDLGETSVIQLGELGQIVDIRNNVTQVLFQQFIILLSRGIVAASSRVGNDAVDFDLGSLNSLDDFLGSHLLEGENLVEFSFQLFDEAMFIIVGPAFGWGGSEQIFQAIIVDVVPFPILLERRTKLMTKPK